MFPEIPKGLSFTKIISGLSKTLNIAQQVIPIYEGAKPMVSNARKAFGILKNLNLNDLISKGNSIKNTNDNKIIDIPLKKTTLNKSSFNSPVFFK